MDQWVPTLSSYSRYKYTTVRRWYLFTTINNDNDDEPDCTLLFPKLRRAQVFNLSIAGSVGLTDPRSRCLETASFPELGFKLRDILVGPPSWIEIVQTDEVK